jgi:hypothetical protein
LRLFDLALGTLARSMAWRKEQREHASERRMAAEPVAAAKVARTRRLRLVGAGAAAALTASVVAVAVANAGGVSGSPPQLRTTSFTVPGGLRPAPSPGPLGPENVPIPKASALASNASAAAGRTVDGIQCNTSEQTIFHIHTHVTIFVNGAPRQVPYGIGIAPPRQLQQTPLGPFVVGGKCFYWLHTHAPDGIIHIESPVQRTYTLGNFFDIWGQQLSPDRVGPAKGKVTSFLNGAPYHGNPRRIPLGSRTQIQLDVGSPLIAPEKISFAGTGL